MKTLFRVPSLFVALMLILSLFFGGAASASEPQQQASFQAPLLVVNTSFLNVRTGPGVQYTVLVTVVGGTELPVLGRAADNVWYQVNTDGGPGWLNVEFTLPRGDFTNVPIVEVGATGAPNVDLAGLGQGGGFAAPVVASGSQRVQGFSFMGRDLRAQPDYNALVLSRSVPNDPSTVHPLLGTTTGTDGTVWYQVSLPGVGIGWTDTVELRILACGTDRVGQVFVQTPITFDGISTRDSFLLNQGTELLILGFSGTANQFYRVQLTDGTVGFVSVSAIGERTGVNNVCTGLPNVAGLGQGGGGTTAGDVTGGTRTTVPQLTGNRVVINTGFLNLRSGPAAGYSVVATVAGGTELLVLGRATDNVWFLVEGDFGQGWLNSQFTLFRGDYSTVPVIRELIIVNNGAPVNAGQAGGVAAPSSVASGRQVTGVSLIGRDMHQAPSYESLTLSRAIPNDPSTIYPLLATQNIDGAVWYLVDVPNVGRGWMDGVTLRLLECGNDSVGVVNEQQPVTFDGFSARDSFLLDIGTEVYIVGRRGDFAIIELLDGSVGLFRAQFLSARTGITNICTGVNAIVGGQTTGGTTSPNTSTGGNPVLAVTGNRVVINTGNLNVRSGPAAGFSVVATVPGGSELAVIGRAPDGVWYYVEGTFGRGWINNQFVLFRGDYSTVPVLDITGGN